MKHHVALGTRGSRLAVIQAELVAAALRRLDPELIVELKTIVTKGDTNDAPIPLDTVGKSWFTGEIERALAAGEIDLAVHSLKDLPPAPGAGLVSLPVLKRADPRDVLISKTGAALADLPAGAVVGTDSARRRALILRRRPDLRVQSLRGNVQTRLHKLATGPYDAIVLAAAGLDRLGERPEAAEMLDPSWFVPAVGQGVLAAQIATSAHELSTQLEQLQDPVTLAEVAAEQAFARVVGGSCQLPVGCNVRVAGQIATIHALLADANGRNPQVKTVTGPAGRAVSLAEQLARELIAGQASA